MIIFKNIYYIKGPESKGKIKFVNKWEKFNASI